ncbi:MAG: cytochrome-c peroxidase [Pseudomonadota bacterium]
MAARRDLFPPILLLALAACVLVAATLAWRVFAGDVRVDPLPPAGTESGRAALLPLPPAPELPAGKVALGERLFFDKRLSADDSLACAGCHDFARGGTDRLPVSAGVGGKTGPINAPTVFNAALNFVQFWDGRAASLEEQAAGPVHNPLEMASSWEQVVAKLKSDAAYVAAFRQVYADRGITGATIVDAIATYERTLLTESRFDRFLRGERTALSPLERTGYQRFLDYGCASCHQGALLGGNMFQRFGVMDDYFAGREIAAADLGRFNVTDREEDRHVFKVPGLRNVAVTAPYFHDASAASLEQAVVVMARYQIGRDMPDEDVTAIVAFLRSLTGTWQGRELQ